MSTSLSPKRRTRLIRRLQAAHDSLTTWDASLRRTVLQSPGGLSDASSETQVLLALLAEAKTAVDLRLAEFGVNDLEPPVAESSATPEFARSKITPRPPRAADQAISAYRVCIDACHACGRALGAAFREAQAAADAASARILYGSLRAFEKQIWVLDPGHSTH